MGKREILNFLRMFGLSVLNSDKYPDNNCKKKHSTKKNVISHYTSNALPSSTLYFLSSIKNNLQKFCISGNLFIALCLLLTTFLHARFLFFGKKRTETEIRQEKIRKNLKSEDLGKKRNTIKEAGERAGRFLKKEK